MRKMATRSGVASIGVMVACAAFTGLQPVTAKASAAVKWARISSGTRLTPSAGLLRTSDGRLHVVWPHIDGTTFSLHYSTVGNHSKLLATGTILSKWSAVGQYPRLVPGPGGGIRLVFPGGNGQSGSPFDLGAMYTATSNSAGRKWALVSGSISHSTVVPLTDDAAATERNGTPVAAWSGGSVVDYHVGTSPSTPDPNPDSSVAIGAGGAIGPTLARASNGSISVAWFTSSGQSNQGYWVDQILPVAKAKVRAPGSGGRNYANNQPFQSVAFSARIGGGDYLAYCVPSKTVECRHVALWRVGARKALTVPGSTTGHAFRVAIAAAPRGHLWIVWFDTGLNKIRVVKTNSSATGFGQVRSIAMPPKFGGLNGLQAEGSRGTLDVIALIQQTTPGSAPALWDAQLR